MKLTLKDKTGELIFSTVNEFYECVLLIIFSIKFTLSLDNGKTNKGY